MTRTETREQKIQRLIERHVRDRNMDPRSIEETYKFTHVGIEIDPDFFDARLDMGWGFFKDPPRHLDHITRNMIIFVYLAYRRSTGCFHQGTQGRHDGRHLRADGRGARGGACRRRRPDAASRLRGHPADEDRGPRARVPGGARGRNHWVKFDYRPGAVTDPKVKLPMTQEDMEDNIRHYYSAELGAGQIADDLIYASRIDPDFWSRYCRLAWGVYQEKDASSTRSGAS